MLRDVCASNDGSASSTDGHSMSPSTNPQSKTATAVAGRARRFARSAAVTNILLLKQIWVWPILAAVALAAIGLYLRSAIEGTLRNQLQGELQTIVRADVTALRNWAVFQKAIVKENAADDDVVAAIERLCQVSSPADGTSKKVTQLDLLRSEELQAVRNTLDDILAAYGFDGFMVIDDTGVVLAAGHNDLIGTTIDEPDKREFYGRVRGGEVLISPPYKSQVMLKDQHGAQRAQVPTMFSMAPVYNSRKQVIAILGFRIRPWEEFTRILQVGRFGASGETYAFDKYGTLISQSRFEDQLRQIGLLSEGMDSTLNLQIRDPGADLTTGARPGKSRSEQPLTRMAESAIAGDDGVDVSGYADYRGVPVVGAWQWLDDLGFGIATEVDVAEAFQTLYILRTVFWSMFALLGCGSVAIFAFSVSVARWKREARKAALDAKQLGQYTLDEKLGEGGMGVVYRAHHAMLHRPTAVKFLDPAKTNELSLGRFEREVQLTARLNHPNTISVYDYGRTPEGVFYYAMEYLDGISLEELVEKYGLLPEGRVIHILQQVCGSLAEAHSLGLVHRDIKPGNILINRRGGIYDFVKVLDFGLARAVHTARAAGLTATGMITGTPLYMSPEAIEHPETVDARSDLYALGAVAYFLLTGTPVFDGASLIEIIQHHVKTPPEKMSDRAGRTISFELEAIVQRMLAKSPVARSQSAGEVARILGVCSSATSWTQAAAKEWWDKFFPLNSDSASQGSPLDQDYSTTVVGNTAQERQH